ncbi:hypothetical protein LWI29_034465 [Acer saccharum]|uniref:R3H domain-containing protein n=1 Tax=Acer saccharum TaxID=4024 RepID=A0AA39S940_ACESA|nr:hypothetical protein LWI29_034465 [Acer saccharum]
MSLTQFAMVEELAFLVKDNLPSKHLVLSMEEALVNFLQDDNGADGVLELEPMNPYNRLLLHRLADIFGFSHESIGEGDERHLVLERCLETSIPSILVSDILWQYGEPETLTTSHLLLRKKEAPPELKNQSPSIGHSLEEREAAYLAARERIFSTGVCTVTEPVRQKPRNVPVVARRMIAHALGQKIKTQNEDDSVKDSKEGEDKVGPSMSLEACQDSSIRAEQNGNLLSKPKTNREKYNAGTSGNGRSKSSGNKEYSKEQHVGAAKRMFAHALGLHAGSAKDAASLLK